MDKGMSLLSIITVKSPCPISLDNNPFLISIWRKYKLLNILRLLMVNHLKKKIPQNSFPNLLSPDSIDYRIEGWWNNHI